MMLFHFLPPSHYPRATAEGHVTPHLVVVFVVDGADEMRLVGECDQVIAIVLVVVVVC